MTVPYYSKVLDLFPEAPAPDISQPKRRKAASPRARASESAVPANQPPKQSLLPSATEGSELAELDAVAARLNAHPDFRVLRRLAPRLDWPPAVQPGPVTRVAILDTETTGLDHQAERIIELALLCVDIDQRSGLPVGPVQVYDGLEDPGKPIPPEIVKITGIKDADVAGQALDESHIDRLLNGVDLVIAHNAGFDRPFVERRIPRFAALPWACSFADIDWKAQGLASAKLEALAQNLGLFYDAHRAEMDCHALLAVLAAPLPMGEGTGLQRLLASAAEPSFQVQATHAPFEVKDQLKARGYRWNGEQRVWQTRLRGNSLLAQEFEWLRASIYGSRPAAVQVETQDALHKYSVRPGLVRQQAI